MSEKPVELDAHRGMAAQKATDLRRLLSEVAANEQALRARQQELEDQLLASPAHSWEEAAEKARYLLSLFASSPTGQDPRRQMLIARVLEDFARLTIAERLIGSRLGGRPQFKAADRHFRRMRRFSGVSRDRLSGSAHIAFGPLRSWRKLLPRRRSP